MILAYIVYTGLLAFLGISACTVSRIRENQSVLNWVSLIPIMLASIILGCRYDVGVDFPTYLEYYKEIERHTGYIPFEVGYDYINRLCSSLGFGYYVVLGITVFIQLSFFYLGLDKHRFLLPYAILFFFLTGQLFFQLNVVRQAMSSMIFLFAIRFIENREFVRYTVVILFASLFHNSSLLLLPVYIFGLYKYSSWLEERKIAILLYIITAVGSNHFMVSAMEGITQLFLLIGKGGYAYTVEGWDMEVNSGLGILLLKVLDGLTLWLACGLVKKNVSGFLVFYRIFFIGTLLGNLFGINVVLSRIPFPLLCTRPIVLAYLFYFTYRWRKKGWLALTFILCAYILLYLANIANGANQCSPYYFFSH